MKVLVVGGTGLIGGDIALYLAECGHEVSLMARKPPQVQALQGFSFLPGDYINEDFSDGRLQGFDALVFAAAADIRNLPLDGSESPEAFYSRVNDEAVPRFFAAAKTAGIRRAVLIGTFYPQVAPHRIGVCPYVTSRHNTAMAVVAMNSPDFVTCCVNPPFVLGNIPGLVQDHIAAMVAYARGELEAVPVFAPEGGTNHMTSRSIACAVGNVLESGVGGSQYLIGDENLSWQAYLEMWFSAAGNAQAIAASSDDHPLLPNAIMFAGAGATVHYETDSNDAIYNYPRGQMKAMIEAVIAAYS